MKGGESGALCARVDRVLVHHYQLTLDVVLGEVLGPCHAHGVAENVGRQSYHLLRIGKERGTARLFVSL